MYDAVPDELYTAERGSQIIVVRVLGPNGV